MFYKVYVKQSGFSSYELKINSKSFDFLLERHIFYPCKMSDFKILELKLFSVLEKHVFESRLSMNIVREGNVKVQLSL